MTFFKKLLIALTFCACVTSAQADIFPHTRRPRPRPIDPPVMPTPMPRPIERVPQIIVRPDYQPLTIQDLSVKTDIIGNIATTAYEMTIFNPNSATLEAEFVFPMTENQTVAAVALDINGKMREGVVVEKEKARQTFEAVVRQGADPLLVEKTAGNQFKTRIYPFTPRGTRKIRVVLEEPLNKQDGAYIYELPLTFAQKLATFNLDIEVPVSDGKAPEVITDIPNFTLQRSGTVMRSHFAQRDYELNNTLSFKIPPAQKAQVFTHAQSNRTYFYGSFDTQKAIKDKVLPRRLAIVWDSSLSGAKRNIQREKALLSAYVKKIGNISLTVVPFNIEQGTAQNFEIQNGDTTALESYLDGIIYDGATRFGTLKLNEVAADEFLMFTDGITTFAADDKLTLPNKPLYIVSSSPEFEPEKLKGWAQQTFGSFINLRALNEQQALEKLMRQPLRIVKYDEKNVSEVYPVVGTEIDENVNFAGILRADSGELNVSIGYDENNIVQTHQVVLKKEGDNSAVARLWAIQKINYLTQDKKKNKDEILKLGQQYSVVTDNTSLLVLENAADYWRYHITPPEDLQPEYNRLQKSAQQEQQQMEDAGWDEALSMAKQVKQWWELSFDIQLAKRQRKYERLKETSDFDAPTASTTRSPSNSRRRARRRTAGGGDSGDFFEAATSKASSGVVDRLVEGVANFFTGNDTTAAYDTLTLSDSLSDDVSEVQSAAAVVEEPGAMAMVMEDAALPASAPSPLGKMVEAELPTPEPKGLIQVKAWDPDTPYLKILKSSTDAELYADYLKLKKGFADQPSFYFDIVDEFIRRNQNDKALIVLSNVSEMQLDNVELIRVAANKLQQINQTAQAVELFEKLVELRGEDPQTYRDLALAYQADGQYQKAFDTFYHILKTRWQRFAEIKQVVFVELNNLLALHPEVDTKDLSKEFIFNMPVDVRIVLGWSTDNTDIDLHVIDPIGEECFYQNTRTQIGGRYTYDFRQGFGPEEFMLKKAANGKYIIRTNNFGDSRQSISGPSTLYLDLYTNYGRANQQHERLLVRAGQVKERNEIGDITWSGNKDED